MPGQARQAAYRLHQQVGVTMSAYPHLDALTTLASKHPQWHWYAIADSAQDKSLPAAIAAPGADVRCLLGATQGSPLAEQSPHLVRMDRPTPDSAAWQWIARSAPRKPCVTVVASSLPFEALFGQLKQFTDISLPDDYDMFFGFWDPAILGTLVGQADDTTLHVEGPVFDLEQRRMLFGGLAGWWYWDRDGGLHSVDVGGDALPVRLPKPIILTQDQVDDLVEASVPDHVLYFVDLNQPHLLRDIPVKQHYAYVKLMLSGARAVGLSGMRDLVNYVCMTLIFGDQWSSDKRISDLLLKVKNGEMDFSHAIDLLPPPLTNERGASLQ